MLQHFASPFQYPLMQFTQGFAVEQPKPQMFERVWRCRTLSGVVRMGLWGNKKRGIKNLCAYLCFSCDVYPRLTMSCLKTHCLSRHLLLQTMRIWHSNSKWKIDPCQGTLPSQLWIWLRLSLSFVSLLPHPLDYSIRPLLPFFFQDDCTRDLEC
jgi:hypothetical protein